jgi:hypothetical protein
MSCNAVYFINNYVFKDAPIHLFGGVVLNNTAGGVKPHVVDAAIKYGAKIVWMPTLSAENHIEEHKKHTNLNFPKTKDRPLEEIPLRITDKDGRLLPEISQICQLIAKADIILATGHLFLGEIRLLIDEALKQGVKKIMVNHPEYIVNASIEDMIELASKGVFMEHSYAVLKGGAVSKEYWVEMIRKVGAERTTIGSDLGQVNNPFPVDGLRTCIEVLLEMGIREEEIDLMLRKNPSKLLGLE